jgi:hypothetical protein
MTTYTVIDHDGYEIASGLTLEQAADEIMSSDSREWQLRKDAKFDGWAAWSRQQVANRDWTETVFYSSSTDEAAALAEISQKIVSAERMAGHYEAITDEQFSEMKAAALAEDDE